MAAKLWIREALGKIREYALDEVLANGEEGIVLGRDDGADVTLEDPSVSRFHARLTYSDETWRVLDLGSSNKTYVNGDPIREAILEPGDQLGIGDCELHLIDEVAKVPSTPSRTQVLSSLTANLEIEHPESARAASVLRTLYELSQQLVHTRDSEALLEAALKSLTKHLSADRGAVLAIEGDALLCRAAHSLNGQALRGFVLSQTIYREVMQSREAVLSEDTASDTRFQQQQSIVGEEIRSIVAAPIPTSDGIGGILYLDRLQSAEGSSFEAEDLYGVAVAAEMLGAALNVGEEIQALQGEREQLVRTIIETHPIIGTSGGIRRVREFISRAAPTESTVLIQGDTGTGKELVARAIHYQSPRAGNPFVAINCAAIPETLVESELFGHEKGSFTGAVGRRLGKFEAANNGTVFLDEIGELPLSCQSKLLRLLEERCFERVGGTESVAVDVRIVAATNRNLATEAEEGNFREDLFYRLNVLQVTVPALRERPDDIELLIEHFLDHFSERVGTRRKRLSKEARNKLVAHPWPGNVRQLRNTLESGVVMASGDEIELNDLPMIPSPKGGATAAWQPRSLQEMEREHVERVLDSVNWNKSKAAEILGIERSTLYARIRNYEIKPPSERG